MLLRAESIALVTETCQGKFRSLVHKGNNTECIQLNEEQVEQGSLNKKLSSLEKNLIAHGMVKKIPGCPGIFNHVKFISLQYSTSFAILK